MTVQAPQPPSPHPSFVPVRPISTRRIQANQKLVWETEWQEELKFLLLVKLEASKIRTAKIYYKIKWLKNIRQINTFIQQSTSKTGFFSFLRIFANTFILNLTNLLKNKTTVTPIPSPNVMPITWHKINPPSHQRQKCEKQIT